MKVVIFQRNVKVGYSIENITLNLAKHLPKDAEVKIFQSPYLTKGILNRIRFSLQAMRHQGDVNHINGDVHYLALFLNKKKTILSLHDCSKLVSSEMSFLRRRIYKLFWFELPALFCRYIHTISEESKNNLALHAGIDINRIKVIYVGVDSRFRAISLTIQEKEKLLNNTEKKKTILHVSLVMPHKNVLRLIEAIKEMNVKYIKVGNISNEEERLLKKYNIDYLAFENIDLDLLVKIYNAVDCLVFPSLIEGFGMPVVEAQRCGCPVVTSNISSLPEIAGSGAVFVDPYSVDSIAEGIRKVLFDENLRSVIVRKGFENAKRFEWEKIASEYYAFYCKVASNFPKFHAVFA